MNRAGTPLIHSSFDDFDAFATAAYDWNLEYSKLDTLPFKGEIAQRFFPDCTFGRGTFSGRHKQLGAPPPGVRTFAFFADPKLHMLWRGQSVNGTQFAAFPLDGELNAVTAEAFDIFTISLPESTLLQTARQLGFQGLETRMRSKEVLQGNVQKMGRLRHCLQRLTSTAPDAPIPYDAAKEQALMLLVEALAEEPSSPSDRNRSKRRRRVIQQVDRIIMSHPEDPPSVRHLCTQTGVSERTLEYAFSEYCGMRPKAYINAMRLNGVRRELPRSKSVSDAANAWGFWHMGQFARDYRKLFGELPSITFANQH